MLTLRPRDRKQPEVAQLVNGRANIQTLVFDAVKLVLCQPGPKIALLVSC